MTSTAAPPPWDRRALGVVVALCAVKALLHLPFVGRYGYHGDELYFLECGRRLAFGYVDHPPLIPWIARLADALGGGLFVLRLPAIAAGVATLASTALLVREGGGGRWAQALALLALLVAPAHLRLGAMLNIPVWETFLCTLAAYLVARAAGRGERWTWVLAGVALGLAGLAKHSAILWGGALAVGLVASPARRALRTPWPWWGLAAAAAIVAPNLLWQATHGFPTLEFMRTLRSEVLAQQGRGLFVAGQLLYFHPLTPPIWLAGLWLGFRPDGEATRPFAVLFAVMSAFLLIVGGKPYYLASAYPPLLAAGGIVLERALATRATLRRAFLGSLAATGAALAVLTLPILPLPTVDAAIGRILGWAVPPLALTHDMHGMVGWEEHAATVERVYRSLPAAEQAEASVLAGSYSQAAAVNRFKAADLPRAVSGHMTYFLWGPDGERGEVLIAYGLPLDLLERHYRRCGERGRIEAPLARPWDTDLAVYVCRGPDGGLRGLWPELRRFGHAFVASAAEPASGLP